MLNKERHTKHPFIFLAISLSAFLLLGLDQLLSLNYINAISFRFNFSKIVHGFLQALTFAGSFLFLRDYAERKEIFSVNILLRRSLILGIVTLLVYYVLEFLPEIYLGIKQGMNESGASRVVRSRVVPTNPKLDYILELLKPLVIVYYLGASIMLFKKLIFFKKSKWDIIWWNLLQIILLLSLVFCFNWSIPKILYLTFGFLGGSMVLLLSVRLKWIGFLKTQDKLYAILYLVLINLITIMLLQNFFYAEKSNVIITDFNRNIYMLLIGFSVLLYSVFSILALIFNLPTSTVAEQKDSELQSFQELTRIQGNLNTEQLFEKLFKIALDSTKVEGAFLLIDDPKDKYRFYATHQLKGEQVKALKKYCSQSDQGMNKQLLFLNSTQQKEKFTAIRDQYQSLFYQPILLEDRKIGDLFLFKSFAYGFDEYMLRLIKSYISQLMMTIRNVELLEETLEATRLKEEMQIARNVQQKLLPKNLPSNEHFEVSAYYLSAHEVGGDYYDYAEVNDLHKLIIADVSGKGTNAAFHVAEMKGVFQALMHLKLSGKEFLNIANQSISNCFDKGIFITLSYLSIDTANKVFTHSRAGHCPTLYYNSVSDEIEVLEEKGLAFGILRNDSYASHIEISQHNYNKNDVLLFYTDGILEARKKNATEEFGMDRVKKLLLKHKNLETKDILDKIIDSLSAFTQGDMSFDDTTLLVIKFK